MPSRQERRKAERDAAKRAPAQAGAARAAGGAGAARGAGDAGAAGAGGAAAALANANMNPVNDWTTQTEDPSVLFRAVGDVIVAQRAAAGDREAQFSLGYRWVRETDVAAGATSLGASGRSPQADVGLDICTARFPCLLTKL